MKFSIVRIDKKKALHLTTKDAGAFLERIKTDTKSEGIGGLRRHIATFGDSKGYEQRTPIARVFPAVELAKEPNGNLSIVNFNGLVVLHVGGLMKQEDVEAVKEASRMMPTTFAAFAGADGRSVEVLVSVCPKDGRQLKDEQEMDQFCKIAYDVAFNVYSGILLKPIERQPVSARYSFLMTLDAEPYVNTAHSSLTIEHSPLAIDRLPLTIDHSSLGIDHGFASDGAALNVQSSMFNVQSSQDVQWNTDMTLYGDYELIYKRAAEEAFTETADVIESQWQEAYMTELARRLCEKGLPEEEAFLHIRNHHVYSRSYDEYTIRAIVSAVYGESRPKLVQADEAKSSRDMRRLIKFLMTRYVFRNNTVMGYVEYRPNNTWVQDWAPCDENAINGLTIEARLANLDVRDKDVRRYVHSNFVRKIDPTADYLWRIHDKWDGKTDHIGELARTVPCDFPQWEKWFRKWFLYMVAQWRGLSRDFGNAIVPLLISPQGDGKSFFCQNLLPRELRWGYYPNLDVSEKRQTLQAMHNFLLINLDEFNQISSKVQEGFLKNVIQLPSVKIKRPYGRHVEEFPRLASFIATTNEERVLADPTGNRRFICVRLTAPVDMSYKPNYEQLYSQAWQLLDQGEQYWFTPDEVKAVMEHNREFEMEPPAVQYFREYFDITDDEEQGTWMTVTAIYQSLRRQVGAGLQVNGSSNFGRYLTNMPGIRRRRAKKGREYLVIPKF